MISTFLRWVSRRVCEPVGTDKRLLALAQQNESAERDLPAYLDLSRFLLCPVFCSFSAPNGIGAAIPDSQLSD
jgi:hypothetical protein